MAQIGPTFAEEVQEGVSFEAWQKLQWYGDDTDTITGRDQLTPAENTKLDEVIAAHNPAKLRAPFLSTAEFISRWTNAEYRALQDLRMSDNGKTGKDFDVVTADNVIQLDKKRTQSFKADLVSAGVLTQARADEIFA